MTRKHRMPQASLAVMAASARPPAVLGAVRNEGEGVDPKKVESLLTDVKSEINRISDEVKQTAETALKQSKDAGTATDEVKAKADELLTNQSKLTESQTKLEGKLEQLETRNNDIEQMLADRRAGGGQQAQSPGQQVAQSEDLKAFVSNGARGSLHVEVNNAITSTTPGGGGLIWTERESEIVRMPQRQMTIRQLLNTVPISTNAVEYVKQVTRTNAAAMTSETTEKPESNYEWEKADANVRTVAHWVHVSRQALDDAGQLQGEIDGELAYGLDLVEETQLLKGDGTGQNLSGLVTEATAYSAPFSVSGETMIDTMRLALLQASLAEYPADGIVLHPTDWARIELTKDGESRYIFANVMQMAGPQLWGRPVISTQSMDEDEFLVGAFRTAATIYDRMSTEILISSEDRDNFIKNMLTIRGEKRLALAVKRPAALITGDFGNVSG